MWLRAREESMGQIWGAGLMAQEPISASSCLCLSYFLLVSVSPCISLPISLFLCFPLSVSLSLHRLFLSFRLCLSVSLRSLRIFFYLPLSVVSVTGRSGPLSALSLTPAPTSSPPVQVG